VREDGELREGDFYCWQHKEQAEQKVVEKLKGARVGRRSTEVFPLRERSSIDTLVQRLGIAAVSGSQARKTEKRARVPGPPRRTETRDFAAGRRGDCAPYAEKYDSVPSARRKTKSPKPGFWASLCCVAGDDDEDYVEIVQHKKRVEQSRPQEMTATSSPAFGVPPRSNIGTSRSPSVAVSARRADKAPPARPAEHDRRDSSRSQTGQLLSLIPQHLSPQTTSLLLAELCKPISSHDEEGYIYIFWLTPQAKQAPAGETARSLLAPPSRPHRERRISDVMTEYSFDSTEPVTRGKRTIMLKIGRASNVTRRMNEWQRQCGYALNLVRWYPYVPSPPSDTAAAALSEPLYPDLSGSRREGDVAVRKVPCAKRVERLVHLELAEMQVKRQCAACGKEHREWFEVEASQAGVRAVDECVRRWVGWAEGRA